MTRNRWKAKTKSSEGTMKVLRSVCCLLLSAYCLLSFAQAPDTVWTKTYGGNGWDCGYGVKETVDGGYIIAGAIENNAIIIKTDSFGDTIWSKVFDVYGSRFYDVVQSNDGGYAFLGGGWLWYESDWWLVKTDSLGDTLWTQVYGSLRYDCGYSIKQTNDGGFILLGDFEGAGSNFYTFLWKTDSQGVYTTGTSLSGSPGHEVVVTQDNGFIVAVGASGNGACIAKTDSLCNLEWEKFYSGQGNACIQSVCQTPDGGYFAVGYAVFNDGCIWLLRMNQDGDTLWTKTYNEGLTTPWSGSKMAIRYTADAKYIIGAALDRPFEAPDIHLTKISPQGDVLWEKSYGGSNTDLLWSLEPTSDNGYILIGSTESFGAGSKDIWLVKIETDTFGISEKKINTINPQNFHSSILNGPLLLREGKQYKVFDITGREIHTLDPVPGIYFIQVDGEIKKKIIKVR